MTSGGTMQGGAEELLRWLNDGDARTRKRHQATLARYESMSEQEQLKECLRYTRYMRTRCRTMESLASSWVNACMPGSPGWREACAARDEVRRYREMFEAILSDWDRHERKTALRLLADHAQDS